MAFQSLKSKTESIYWSRSSSVFLFSELIWALCVFKAQGLGNTLVMRCLSQYSQAFSCACSFQKMSARLRKTCQENKLGEIQVFRKRDSGPRTSLWTPQREGHLGGLAEEDLDCGLKEVCFGKDKRDGLRIHTAGRVPGKQYSRSDLLLVEVTSYWFRRLSLQYYIVSIVLIPWYSYGGGGREGLQSSNRGYQTLIWQEKGRPEIWAYWEQPVCSVCLEC